MAADKWNEKETLVLKIEFFDENDDPVTPDDAWYTVEDLISGQRVVEHTHLPGTMAPVMSLVITDEQNVFVNPTLPVEKRVVTIEWDYDQAAGKHGTWPYYYDLKRMKGIST